MIRTLTKGITLIKNPEIAAYHVSAPIVTDLTGGTLQAPFVSHIINLDFSGMAAEEEEAEFGAVPTKFEAPDYVRFCFGESSYNNLSSDVIQ